MHKQYSNRATFNALLHNPEILKNRPLCNLLESISCARGPATPVGSLKSLPARSNPKLVLTFKHPQAQAQQAPRRRSRVKSVGHAPVSVSGGGGGAAGGHSHSHSHSHNHSHTPSSSENIPVLTPRPRTPTVHLISKGAKLRVPGDVGSAQMFGAPLLISEC